LDIDEYNTLQHSLRERDVFIGHGICGSMLLLKEWSAI
jgi:hypothetical protein